MKPIRTLFAALLLAAVAWAQNAAPDSTQSSELVTSKPAADSAKAPVDTLAYAFHKAYISIEGGEMYPFGDLVDAVENSFYGGIGFRYSYWPDFDGFIHFNYAYVKVRAEGIPFPGVHQFVGRIGLDWHWRLLRPLAIGAGFTCNWTRDDSDEEDKYYEGRGGMLLDNETEFGWFARVNMPFTSFKGITAGLNVLWEQLWTLPERSNTLTVGFYLERRIW